MSPAKRSKRPQTPAGLVAMFQLLADPDVDGRTNKIEATQVFPLCRRLIADIRDGERRSDALLAALKAIYPDVDEPEDPSYGLDAGFRVGVAAAWLVLRDINGGAR